VSRADTRGGCRRCLRSDEARVRAAGNDFGVSAQFTDHRDLLNGAAVDLLTICTMPSTHRGIALDAFAAGAAVLCEKPLATTLEDGRAIVSAAEACGAFFSVGFNLRYSSAAAAVRRFVEEGRLGEPVCARGSMLGTDIPWWGSHHDSRASGGGAIAVSAVHLIDLMMWLAGSPRPVAATASMVQLFPRKRAASAPEVEGGPRYDVDDLAFGHVRFESGFWMTIEGAWTWDEPGRECHFDLVGDRAQASAAPLRFSGERDGSLADITDGAVGDLDFPHSTQRELASVVHAVAEKRPSLVTLQQALDVQAVTDALYRSAKVAHEVEIAPISI
jgi:predicted dehydrogenase